MGLVAVGTLGLCVSPDRKPPGSSITFSPLAIALESTPREASRQPEQRLNSRTPGMANAAPKEPHLAATMVHSQPKTEKAINEMEKAM